jgi:hypothetical protein
LKEVAMLFTDRSIVTMIHGVGLGGAVLVGLAAAMFHLYAAGGSGRDHEQRKASGPFAMLMLLTAGVLWLTTLTGTYVVFPPYRATPPPGLADLSQFPRSLIQADADTVWLHAFGMEIKEHAPWIAAMLATAVAFVSTRHGSNIFDAPLRGIGLLLLAICFALVSAVALLGVFINKVAPLQ